MARTLTRRLFLGRAAVAAPLAVMPSVAIAATDEKPKPALVAAAIGDDGRIFRLAKEYRRARKAYEHLEQIEEAARERFEAAKPKQPISEPYSQEEAAELGAMLASDLMNGRYGPLLTAYNARIATWKDRAMAAWKADVEALRQSTGYADAFAARARARSAMCEIAEALFKTRAQTLDGMMVKTRIQVRDDYDSWLFEREIAEDLRALKRAGAVVATKAGRA